MRSEWLEKGMRQREMELTRSGSKGNLSRMAWDSSCAVCWELAMSMLFEVNWKSHEPHCFMATVSREPQPGHSLVRPFFFDSGAGGRPGPRFFLGTRGSSSSGSSSLEPMKSWYWMENSLLRRKKMSKILTWDENIHCQHDSNLSSLQYLIREFLFALFPSSSIMLLRWLI